MIACALHAHHVGAQPDCVHCQLATAKTNLAYARVKLATAATWIEQAAEVIYKPGSVNKANATNLVTELRSLAGAKP